MVGSEPRSASDQEYRTRLLASIARELHDGAVQSLTASVLRLEGFRDVSTNPAMQSAISDVEGDVRRALSSLRRLIGDLRAQAPLEDVAATIRNLAAGFERSSGRQVTVVVSPEWPALLPAETALNLERLVQEAVTNAIRHAHASQVLIELRRAERFLVATVSDNGSGIPRGTRPGSGIIGMRERAVLIGGRLTHRRRNPGTEVEVRFPAP